MKELYGKMLKSVVEKRTMPPNAWLWSLIGNCATHNDIKLLFDILQRLRVFVRYSLCFFFAFLYLECYVLILVGAYHLQNAVTN